MRAYLDHAATTPLRPEALAAMLPYLTEHFGNASGSHALARRARRAVDEARDDVARCLGCDPGELVFTSGGTEAANLAVLGADGTVLCSAVEHDAVRNACRAAGGSVVPVGATGVVDLDALADILGRAAAEAASGSGAAVGLVSVMLANNEVGTVQPLGEVAEVVRRHAPQARLHTDAVAAVGWMDVSAATAGTDLVSISAHKFGGPKGVGALVVRSGTTLRPVIHGGPQERERRPGTLDVASIVGMAAALRCATGQREDTVRRVGALRDRLAAGLVAAVDGLRETVVPGTSPVTGGGLSAPPKLASSCHVCVDGVDQEELLVLLDDQGVCASAGAACASGALEPSHVLLAMGLGARQARSALRLTLGYSSTDDDVDHVLAVLPKAVERLRAGAGPGPVAPRRGPAGAAPGPGAPRVR